MSPTHFVEIYRSIPILYYFNTEKFGQFLEENDTKNLEHQFYLGEFYKNVVTRFLEKKVRHVGQ